MIRVKNKKTHVFMLVLLLILGIGFAALAATLKINGTITIDSAKWDVHFENVEVAQGSVTATTVPTSDDATTTEMTYAVDFTKPGDFYEFTVDIANDGTIDAMVDLVTNKVYASDGTTEKALPAYLKSTVTYDDDVEIKSNQLLAKQTSEKIKVRVEFRSDVEASDLPSTNETTVFKFSSTFKQADETSCQRPTTFENDSWDVIQCNVRNNPLSYPIGAEKTIEMDIDGDNTNETYTLRVANNTTPAECSTQGFSQTACGFVVEFKDIVENRVMNSSSNTNAEGWKNTTLITYLNGDFYNKLPSNLKNVIIPTCPIVSGSGKVEANIENSGVSENITASDTTKNKIYLLSGREVGFDSSKDNKKDITTDTRTLDYYSLNGSTVVKKDLNNIENHWWLRSANSENYTTFCIVSASGSIGYNGTGSPRGVSPAFRIG